MTAGLRTFARDAPTRTTGRSRISGRRSRSRISPRAFGTEVVPSRVSASSFGCTVLGDQRTRHSSPDRRRRSVESYPQPPMRGIRHRSDSIAVAESPDSFDVAQRGFEARAVEAPAVRPQGGRGRLRVVGQPGGRGVVAGAPAPDEDLGGLLGTLTGERPVRQEAAGERHRHEGHESG